MAVLTLPLVSMKLISLDGDVDRNLHLRFPDTRIVVGRASKNAATAMMASGTNAWIESPVTSREHATLKIGRSAERVRTK